VMTFSDLFEFLLYLLQKKSYNILFGTTFFLKNDTFFDAHSIYKIFSASPILSRVINNLGSSCGKICFGKIQEAGSLK
jgi:hypothetical protein